jgi:glycosyltransferase involved in cell wall biosynthesis
MLSDPLVSVVTPAFNAGTTIAETIESVRAQTYPHWEMLVVDDASADDTAAIVAGFAARDPRIRLIRLESNSGAPGRAKNAALPLVRGEFLAFLDADDLWSANKLELQLDCMREADADLCYTGGWYIDRESNRLGAFAPRYGAGWLFDRLLGQYEINNQTVMIRRQVVEALALPRFNPEITIGEDCDLFMRIARNSMVLGVPDPLVYYRVHGDSISATRLAQAHEGLQEVVQWVKQDPELLVRCQKGLRKAEGKIRFYKAKAAMAVGDGAAARALMWPAASVDWRYAVLALVTLSPRVWRWCLSFSRRSV